MNFAVVLLGVGQFQPILHAWTVLDTLEVVVPATNIWNHVEAHESAHQAGLRVSTSLCTITVMMCDTRLQGWSDVHASQNLLTCHSAASEPSHNGKASSR